MPLCNLRSIIEILIPGDTGSWVADTLLYQVGVGSWLCIPLIVIIAFAIGGLWLAQKNFRLFLYVVIPLAILNIWTQATSKYGYNPLPHTVPVDHVDPNQATSSSDYSQDGKYVWQDDDSRLDAASWGTSYVVHYQKQAIPGQITQEEVNYQTWLRVENADLILNGVYSASEYNSSLCYQIRDYLRAREAQEQALMPLHNGGFYDRIKYRWAIDEMNEKPSPIQTYIDARHKADAKAKYELWGPVVFGILALMLLSYAGKYFIKLRMAVGTKVATARWDALLAQYNRARVIKTGLEIDGPTQLRYPKLFINDAPFDLEKAETSTENPNVIVLRDGTQLYLYHGYIPPAYLQEPPVNKRKPKWLIEDTAPAKREAQSQSVVTGTQRRSIFSDR